MNESSEEELLFFETFSHDNSEVSLSSHINVSNTSGAGNGHFRDLQTTANDVRKEEKT